MGPLLQSGGVEWWSPGRSENRHSLEPVVSRQPRSSSVLSLEKMVTFVFSNKTRHPWSQRGPIFIRLWWKLGIMYPVVTGSGRYTLMVAAERCGGPLAVPTTTCRALGSMLA